VPTPAIQNIDGSLRLDFCAGEARSQARTREPEVMPLSDGSAVYKTAEIALFKTAFLLLNSNI